MNIDEIINTPRRVVNVDEIQLPESMEITPNENGDNGKENGEKTDGENVQMSLVEVANMAIAAYNVIQTAIYKRIEPRFDASLTPDECKAIEPPLRAVLAQYNVQMSPITGLIVVVAGINVGKIMQIKMLRAEFAKKEKEEKKKEEEKKEKPFFMNDETTKIN